MKGHTLRGHTLRRHNCKGRALGGHSCKGRTLRGHTLRGHHLEGAHLEGAHLQEANLEGAHLEGAYLQGARLWEASLQGANLERAHLQGIRSTDRAHLHSFEARIRASIGKETDLSGVVFEGGLSQGDVDSFIEGLSDEKAKEELRETLKPHIDKPPSYQLPENSGAITASYTKEEAEK